MPFASTMNDPAPSGEPSPSQQRADWRDRLAFLSRPRRPSPEPAAAAPDPQAAAERRAAFGALVNTHQADLLRVARRLCRNSEDRAQDLVQDALVRAYEAFRAGRFDAEAGSARAWLVRILTNHFINEYRRAQKWDAGLTVDTLTSGGAAGPPQTHAAPGDVPGQTLLSQTLDEPLERALAELSDRLRLCVLLVDVEGLEYAEAARTLGVPIGTVRSRLARARLQLQELLKDYARERGIA